MNFLAPQVSMPTIEMPVNFEAEQQVLGGIMLDNRLLTKVSPVLSDRHFASPVHGRIYQACKALIDRGETANPLTLKTSFASDQELIDLGGPQYLIRVCGSCASRINIEEYARTVVGLSDRRDIIACSLDAIDDAMDPDLSRSSSEVLASLSAALSKIERSELSFTTLDEAIDEVIADLQSDCSGVVDPTGMHRLDKALGGGLYGGKMYGVSARHKVGKTGFMTSISYSLLFNRPEDKPDPVPHLYVCLEMGGKEIAQRLLARRLGINSLAFLEMQASPTRQGYVNGVWVEGVNDLLAKIETVRADFKARGLTFLKRPRMSIDDLRATLAQAAMSGKYRGIIVDGIQLVSGRRKNESGADHTDNVAQTLAEAASQYGMWIVCSAQLNREGLVRGGDGLMNACDMAFALSRKADGNGGYTQAAWLEMSASRYTPYRHLGDEHCPGLILNTKVGPYFEELE